MNEDLCPFCHLNSSHEILCENDSCIAFFDGFPVSPGHLLIIPRRHVPNFFDLTPDEQSELLKMLNHCKSLLDQRFHPDGYNIGVNVNAPAGQSIPHVHLHLIPRYSGDVPNPRGGVRGVIPGKQNY